MSISTMPATKAETLKESKIWPQLEPPLLLITRTMTLILPRLPVLTNLFPAAMILGFRTLNPTSKNSPKTQDKLV